MFHVLLALSDGEKHGYAILKEVAERTEGAVELSTGTLYGLITASPRSTRSRRSGHAAGPLPQRVTRRRSWRPVYRGPSSRWCARRSPSAACLRQPSTKQWPLVRRTVASSGLVLPSPS
jgi:hypothetical protein